jgi:hypothetical protein
VENLKPFRAQAFREPVKKPLTAETAETAEKKTQTGPQRWQEAVLLLNQLPGDLRRKIGTENALRIYRLK